MTTANLFDLTGKVALVTGGGRGLGLSITRGLSAAGADMIVTSRKLDNCEAAAQEARDLGRRAIAVACHMGYWDQIDALIETAYAEFGRIDILVNNAGMAPVTPSSDGTTEAAFDKMLDVNFKGPYRLAAKVARRMADSGEGGSIINVSSTSALIRRPYDSCYAAAKAALNQASLVFAQEYGQQNVRVNTISPGPFLTDISKGWTEETKARVGKSNALHRTAQPDEIITTVLYLASPASSFVTGALIRADGGIP